MTNQTNQVEVEDFAVRLLKLYRSHKWTNPAGDTFLLVRYEGAWRQRFIKKDIKSAVIRTVSEEQAAEILKQVIIDEAVVESRDQRKKPKAEPQPQPHSEPELEPLRSEQRTFVA